MKNIVYPLLLALLLPLSACATKYSAEPIQAWVVNDETSQPMEGVVVVAHWQLEGGLEGGSNAGQMMVMEAVTDATGKFSFPGWGPKEVPSGLAIYDSNARLKNMDPEMLLFKSGYENLTLQNDRPFSELGRKEPYVRTSVWNGKTIRMKKFKGTLKEYADYLDRGGDGLMGILYKATATQYCKSRLENKGCSGNGACEWRNIPQMIVAIGKQTKIFEVANIRRGTFYDRLKSSETYMVEKGCGSVNAFLSEHEK